MKYISENYLCILKQCKCIEYPSYSITENYTNAIIFSNPSEKISIVKNKMCKLIIYIRILQRKINWYAIYNKIIPKK